MAINGIKSKIRNKGNKNNFLPQQQQKKQRNRDFIEKE